MNDMKQGDKNKKVNHMSLTEAEQKLQLLQEHKNSDYYNHIMLHYKRLLVEKQMRSGK